jgi:xylulokinase
MKIPVANSSPPAVIGIDLGTQGVRVLAVSPQGEVLAAAHSALPALRAGLPAGWLEQSPQDWWRELIACLRNILSQLASGVQVSALSVDSTSGTILPVDRNGEPLYPAILYNDRRSEDQAQRIASLAVAHQQAHGYRFAASFGLPKILWLKENLPGLFDRTDRFLHAADFLVGRLTGDFGTTDSSNALKSGVDLFSLSWPAFIETDLGIPLGRLPQVCLPGTVIGQVCAQAAGETGLRQGMTVVAGATDGTAAQLASGASRPGDWNSTLGTTLVLKGITRELVRDPQGRLYSHRHPQGWWMPGGASNTGAEWISLEHPAADLRELDRLAEKLLPTRLLRYPLARMGERFPFIHKSAVGFTLGESDDPLERYASGLEGVAFLEKLAFQVVEQLGMPVGETIYLTGGAARSATWNRIRASVLERHLVRPAVAETAMGAALLAACGSWYPGLQTAVQEMVHPLEVIAPQPGWQAFYAEQFSKFHYELERRGYLG